MPTHVDVVCQECGKVFSKQQQPKPKYCSIYCYHKKRLETTGYGRVFICERCGKPFTRKRLGRNGPKWCSEGCLYPSMENYFWERVDKTSNVDGCWGWTGSKSPSGYGQTGDKRWKYKMAHRMSYAIHYGSIPQGLMVCHRCDNPGCVNPLHLFLGTNSDNLLDASAKGRLAAGSRNGNAKLCEKQVRRIVEEYRKRKYRGILLELSSRYNVSSTAIGRIVRGQGWKHALDTK